MECNELQENRLVNIWCYILYVSVGSICPKNEKNRCQRVQNKSKISPVVHYFKANDFIEVFKPMVLARLSSPVGIELNFRSLGDLDPECLICPNSFPGNNPPPPPVTPDQVRLLLPRRGEGNAAMYIGLCIPPAGEYIVGGVLLVGRVFLSRTFGTGVFAGSNNF